MTQETTQTTQETATVNADNKNSTTIVETYKEVAINDSFNEIITLEGAAFSFDARTTISDKLNRRLSKIVDVYLKVGRKSASGETFYNKYDRVKLPRNLIAADFDALKKAYLATVDKLDEKVEKTCTKRDISEAVPAEERRVLFNKLFNSTVEVQD